MVLVSINVLMVNKLPKTDCYKCLCPQSEPHLPFTSPGSSPRLAGGSDPGFFQITVSTLGPEACEILCMPFKSGVYFPQTSCSPESKLHWPSKPNVPRACLLGAEAPRLGRLMWGLDSLLLGENFCNCIFLLVVGCSPGGMGLDYSTSLPL